MLHKLIHKQTSQVLRPLPLYLELRSRIYYFRYRLPASISLLVNQNEIRFSLHTDSLNEAYSRLHSFLPLIQSIKRYSFHKDLAAVEQSQVKNLIKQLLNSRFQQLLENAPLTLPTTVEVKPDSSGQLFSNIHDQMIEYKKSKGLTAKMCEAYLRYKKLFLLISGDKPVSQLTTRHLKDYLVRVADLPRKNIKPYSAMSWEEVVSLDVVPDRDKVAEKTAKEHLKWLQGLYVFMNFQLDMKLENPTKAIKIKSKAIRYGSFEDHEVNKIFQNAKGKDWQYWLPRLAFYTGARRGELVSLQRKNIKFHSDLGRYYIQITSEDNKSLKTDNALRLVPLSHKIIDLGFIDFVSKIDKEDEFVFGSPKLVTKKITYWFNHRLLNESGVRIIDDMNQKRVFHSTRHTFITKALQKNVQPQLVQEIVGHDKSQGLGITARYTHRFPLKELIKVIDIITY
ncbi:site-specific integrase [Shewanella sp. TC10]|uniref:site-specific integrase n=1 Tax=Shewanella sp. TC10 TaxID=1419739 RepID=UPI00129D22FA|nr:site-specific integrase [Shewanella sp. TC10]